MYTTDVIVNEVQFLTQKQNSTENTQSSAGNNAEPEMYSQEELEKYTQLSAKTVMDTNYNPELAIDDSMLPF